MCRLLAYLGPPIALDRVAREPEHSLVVQSYAPREMSSGVVNADGFGFAWYDAGRQETPFVYKSILPIWSDPNLESLARYVASECILGNVRSATPGHGLDMSNTQPFVSDRLSVLHNGFVDDFGDALRAPLQTRLSSAAWAVIRGSTDSEYLFAWLLPFFEQAATLADGLREGLLALRAVAPEAVMTLNFIVSDGTTIAASRAAQGMAAPSLYYVEGHPAYPDATLIASEALFDSEAWTSLPEDSVASLDPDRHISVRALDA